MHVDVEKAKQTDLGGTIAHGLLTLSLIPYLMKNFPEPSLLIGAQMLVKLIQIL